MPWIPLLLLGGAAAFFLTRDGDAGAGQKALAKRHADARVPAPAPAPAPKRDRAFYESAKERRAPKRDRAFYESAKERRMRELEGVGQAYLMQGDDGFGRAWEGDVEYQGDDGFGSW